jgi:hypothetical protein
MPPCASMSSQSTCCKFSGRRLDALADEAADAGDEGLGGGEFNRAAVLLFLSGVCIDEISKNNEIICGLFRLLLFILHHHQSSRLAIAYRNSA